MPCSPVCPLYEKTQVWWNIIAIIFHTQPGKPGNDPPRNLKWANFGTVFDLNTSLRGLKTTYLCYDSYCATAVSSLLLRLGPKSPIRALIRWISPQKSTRPREFSLVASVLELFLRWLWGRLSKKPSMLGSISCPWFWSFCWLSSPGLTYVLLKISCSWSRVDIRMRRYHYGGGYLSILSIVLLKALSSYSAVLNHLKPAFMIFFSILTSCLFLGGSAQALTFTSPVCGNQYFLPITSIMKEILSILDFGGGG